MVSIQSVLRKEIWKFCKRADGSTERGHRRETIGKKIFQNNARSVTVNEGTERDTDPFGYVFLYNSSARFP